MSFALSRLEQLYLQMETTYGQIPNTSGTATVGNSNACRVIRANLNNSGDIIERPDKTGTLSPMIGVVGRKFGRFSIEKSIAPNGTAGVAPDDDPLWQTLMGQAGSATSGTATITAATNASPIVVTATNSFSNGDVVFISGVTGNTAANGVWCITAVSGSGFTLVGSSGNGVYGSGGTASRVAYKYTLSDSKISCSIWSFRKPSTIDQRVVMGAAPNDCTIELGNDVARVTFAGEGVWMLSSNQFSSADSIQAAGLTAFPSEPSAPVTNGNMIAGFTGKIAIDGYGLATIRTATIRLASNSAQVRDTFGSYYPTSIEGDVRRFGISFNLYEDDTAGQEAIVAAAIAKTPVQIPLFMGTVNGTIFGVVLNNVQLNMPTYDEQRRYINNFDGTAHGSSLTQRDDAVVWFI